MRKLLTLLLVFASSLAMAQKCGFDDVHAKQLLNNPTYKKAVDRAKVRYMANMQSSSNGLQLTTGYGTEYQIPLVVHVIHTGGAVGTTYNPSDATINAMITYLNEAYEATYTSYPDTNSGGVRVPIKFVLAKRGPTGTATTGINRVDGSTLTNYSLRGVNRNNTTGVSDSTVKSLSIWDPADYYNIWIVNKIDSNDGTFGTYTAGYAYFPGASASVDGTVMLATTAVAGNITLTHEIGHAFSLYHTFQGDGTGSTCPTNTNCTTQGDLVCDTEPHKRSPFTCPTGTNSCTGSSYNNVTKNFMDYSNCQDRFTAGQRTRIMDAMTNERSGLGSSLGTLAPGTYPSAASCTTTLGATHVGNTFGMGPTKVVLNDLRSSSGGYNTDGYVNYIDRSKQQRANITQGETYTLSVDTRTNPQKVAVYIDYNNNGTFSASELVYSHTGSSATETHSTSFAVPTSGITTCTTLRMRVLADFTSVTLPTNGCGTMTYGQAEDFTVYVKPQSDTVTLTNAITTGANPTCPTGSVTFTASASKTLTSPSYQWYKNSQEVGTNSSTYTFASPSTGTHYIQCKVGYTNGCSSADSGSTNAIALVSGSTITPSVSIAASPSGSICSGTNVTFTATPTNGGTSPSYQWKVNGTNVGTNSATYSSTTLANSDAVTCVMTSNDPCASPTTATSNTINMSVSGTVTPSVSIASGSGNSVCAGASVTFTATPTNGGTPTYQWKVNGSNVGTNSAMYTTTTLSNGDAVTCEMTSTASCASPTSATSNSLSMTVTPSVTPSVSIASGSGTSICSGANVTFTATPTNGGAAPTYQWKVNGSNVGTNSATYSTTTLTNGQTVTCEMTSNATCASPAMATSNSIAMTVTSSVTPSVSIASGSGTSICSGANVTFTATPTNGGAAPTYQWKVNGSNVGTNSATYSTTTLTNGQTVTCEMTSNASCASPTSATSNSLAMTVSANVTPSVSIASGSGTSICENANVTFTATPTNGGAAPTYQWKVNGSNVGTNSATYSTTSLGNGDAVTCEMTSNATCASPTSATSNTINMTVTTNVTPSVSIASSAGTSVCSGTSVTFTATPTNGGATPSYQWTVNSVNVGTNSATYTPVSLGSGDTVRCIMTTSATCATTTTATSNDLIITITPTVTPSIVIETTISDTICVGTSVTYIATPTNGGTTPSYQWKVDGSNVGTNSTTYTTSTLTNGQTVTCELTSNATCASPATATSNSKTMTVLSGSIVPSVTIVVSPNDTVCAGASTMFTATPVNGGSTPSYQWKVNGSNVGTNSATYTSTVLANGDIVTCVLTSSLSCASPTTGTSNAITMTVNPNLTPIVAISVSPDDTVCDGTSVTFSATSANGGSTPTYQWRVNGTNAGTNSSMFTTSTLNDGDVVDVIMTSSETCVTKAADTSNAITMKVNPILTPNIIVSVSPNDTICDGTMTMFTATTANGGASPTYQWKLNGNSIGTNNDTFNISTLNNGDVVTCVLTTSEVCISKLRDTSNAISMTVNPNLTPAVAVTVSPNDTICDGTSVTFTASPTNGGTTPVYQWKVNNIDVGTNSTTYTSSTLNDGDVVACVMTSSEACVTSSTAISNTITMKVNPIITPMVTIVVSPNDTICANTSTTFTATAVNGGTAPTYQWKINGANVGTNSSTYVTTALADGDVVVCEMISNGVCLTKPGDTSNAITMNVIPNVTPVVVITNIPSDTVCDGTNVTFKATAANGGASPTYQWQVNGTNVGTNNDTYSSTTFSNGDVVRCIFTSSITCVTKTADTSNEVTVGVKSKQTPDITITVSPGDTACAGDAVTFTAAATVTGASPFYQWRVNNTDVGTNSTTFTVFGLSDGDVVRCILRTSDTCVTKLYDTSNAITMTILPKLTPDVTITVSPKDTICDGSSATFTAVATNGGTTPTYQWRLNGTNVGTNSNTFTTPSLVNGDVVDCILTSNHLCLTRTMDTSNSITMVVKPNLTPDVTIVVSPNDTICDGTNVIFTATPTNGGTTPTYQWRINGTNVGTNSNIFITSTLSNNDTVDVILTSSEMCVTKANDTSNRIAMTVNPNLTPDVTITVSPNDTICDGTSVTFTAAPTNGGTTPTYQWRLNGTNVGTNSNTFTTSSLVNNDVIDVILTTSETCITKANDTSNAITMTVNPNLTPDVTITVSPNDTICDGTAVTFTAAPTNGGTMPAYQWKVNGTNVGANVDTFASSTLSNGDVVTVVLTSSETCVTKAMDTSNAITMTVNPNLTPDVTITVSPDDTICATTPTSFTATATNGGTTPTYQWRLNGLNVGVNSNGYTSSSLNNGDIVEVILTSSETCVTKAMDTSNKVTMTVNPLTVPSVLAVANTGTNICTGSEVTFSANVTNGGTTQAYQWRLNGADIAGATNSSYTTTAITAGDEFTVKLTITAVCPAPDTAISSGLVMSVVDPSVDIDVSPNDTICDGTPALFTLTGTNVGNLPKYQWLINGVEQVGAVADMFTIPSVSTGDTIHVEFRGSDNCINVPAIQSDSIGMTVMPTTPPTVGIKANPGTVLTQGDIVWFTSTVSAAPSIQYQWYKNGTPIPGATGLAYTETNPKDGDFFNLWIKVDDSCRIIDTAYSDTIKVQVNPVGIGEVEVLFDDANITPNPNNGTFVLSGTLGSALASDIVNVEIVNTVGVVVHREQVRLNDHKMKTRIELGDKAHNGLHMIRITAGDKVQILKFIANR